MTESLDDSGSGRKESPPRGYQASGGLVPVPDPTLLTTSLVEKAIDSLRAELKVQFLGMAEATRLVREGHDKLLNNLPEQLKELKDTLNELWEAKIASTEGRIKKLDDVGHEKHSRIEQVMSQMQVAETRRIDQLAQTRQEFQNTIRDMLAESVRTTSTLVSTQLVQIQATFDTRVSKLEAGAFTQAGKSSVADPQLADFMRMMSQNIQSIGSASTDMAAKMTSQQAEATAKLTLAIAALGAKEQTGEGRRMGQGQVIAWIVAGFMLLAAVAGPIIAILVRH